MAEYNILKTEYVHMTIWKRFLSDLTILMTCCFLTVYSAEAAAPSEEAPMFHAGIEWSPQGYIVKGTFTEFPSDISCAETFYSLDGEIYQASGEEWNITNWSNGPWTDWNESDLEKFQNQTCLHSNTEPLKSYLAGKLDRFYVKLRLTRENGITCDTQAAIIDRGIPGAIPEELTPIASFAPSIRVRTFRPFSYYGRYQITVSEDASPEEIAALLPDTLPIKVDLFKGIDHVADGIADCPVTWKPLPDLQLTAGESVTVPDAAEEIVVPNGTMLNTPLGIFHLNESLRINQEGLTDEVRLVVNVVAKDSSPTGALSCDYNGLEIAFHQKPTGATAIRAYTLSAGETEWTEISGLPLLEAVNAQPSTPGSGYTYVLDNTHELYLAYMAADKEGREPVPFFIGIKIEGGVYDGKELILPWPSTYDVPLELPKLGGSGGNEDNAGAGNKGDGTSEGQRPDLPDSDNSGGSVNDGSSQGQTPDLPDSDSSGGSVNDGPSQGQTPDLPDSGGKDTVSSGGNSGHVNSQNRDSTHTVSGSDISVQAPLATQAAAGTVAEARYPAAGSPANPGTDARTESTLSTPDTASNGESSSAALSGKKADHITSTPGAALNSESIAPVPSATEGKSKPHTEESSNSRLLLTLTVLFAGLCIIWYLYYRSYRQVKL